MPNLNQKLKLFNLQVQAEKCTGCNCCEMACYFEKAGAFNPTRSRIKVVHFEYFGISVPVLCIQCKKPKCVEVCPVGALDKTGEGIIEMDPVKCTGCGLCVEACVIGAINFDEEKKQPLICDFCGGNPACVRWCPSGALTFRRVGADGGKHISYSIKKIKPLMKKYGIDEDALEWYEQFTR